jgi:hypothetical protein
VDTLNTGLNDEQKFAQKKSFYNWKTSGQVELIELDVGKMKAANRSPQNGIIYSEQPLRLANTANLPGTNTQDQKAAFTLISEESVYLKGDYNTEDWKLSHLVTNKKIYTLSNSFADPQSAPSFTRYNEYPYVYVKVTRDGDGKITEYKGEEGNPANGDGLWVNANSTKSDTGTYYPDNYYGMPNSVRDWVVNKKNEKQTTHTSSANYSPPNSVDKDYSYNSLFISPYENTGDDTLEDWSGRKRNITGAFLNFYDPSDPRYDDEYRTTLSSPEYNDSNFNYRRSAYYPSNEYYLQSAGGSRPTLIQSYDGRFTQSTSSSEAVLGLTGVNVWRDIPQAYFQSQTGS